MLQTLVGFSVICCQLFFDVFLATGRCLATLSHCTYVPLTREEVELFDSVLKRWCRIAGMLKADINGRWKLPWWPALTLGDPLAPTNVATRKYQIWVSLFPGGNFLAKFSYKFLHRWSCTQTAQIALEYYSHTMGVWKSIYWWFFLSFLWKKLVEWPNLIFAGGNIYGCQNTC